MYAKSSRDIEITDVYNKVTSQKLGIITDNYFPSTVSLSSDAVQTTGDVPGWRQLVADHHNATTGLSGHRRKAYSISGYHKLVITFGANLPDKDVNHDVNTYEWSGAIMSGSIPGVGTHASAVLAESQAAAIFLAKAQQALSSFQGGVFLAELGKAIHGIRHPAEALKTYLQDHVLRAKARRALLKKAGQGGKRLNRAISDLWLEQAYHWRPLVADMTSAAESLARISNLDDVKFVSGEGFDEWSSEPSRTTTTFGPQSCSYIRQIREVCKCRFYGQVRAYNDADPGSFSDLLSSRLGLNLAQAAPTVWELIPFSFVADYFSNVGAMISAYSFPTAAISWVNRATLNKATLFCGDPKFSHSASSSSIRYEYMVENPGSFKATTELFQRDPFSASGIMPSFRLTVPGVSGWPKWLNLAALANSIRS